MSADAELLRRAAKAMRERAEAVRESDQDDWRWYGEDEDDRNSLAWALDEHFSTSTKHADAEHIASWHPIVAVAVADSLDRWAELAEADIDVDGTVGGPEALAIARAYLGEAP